MIARLAVAALALGWLAAGGAEPARAVAIEPVESPAGVKAWLVEDHTLKLVSLRLEFRGGAALDPAGKLGLATLVSGLLDEGAGDLDGNAFHGRMEDLAASYNADADLDNFSVSLRVQSANLGAAADLLHLALTAPRFEPAAVARIKGDILSDVAAENEQPNHIADRLWWRGVFGDHPYGRAVLGTPDSVGRIEIADLRNFVHDRFARDNLLIGAVGDITPDALKALLDRLLAGLPPKSAPDDVPEAKVATPNETMLSRVAVPQSAAMFGENGIKRDDPDWYAAILVMHILAGGGFDARLTEEVRVKRGLAYSVSADLEPLDHAGLILGDVATQNARVAQSIEVIRSQWARMRDEGPTDAELKAAKTYVTGSFPLNLDSSMRIAGLLVTIQRDGLGLDYLDRRGALFESVTLDQAKRVAHRLLDPAHLFFVVVGAPENLPDAKPAPALE
jgi:zinc protease